MSRGASRRRLGPCAAGALAAACLCAPLGAQDVRLASEPRSDAERALAAFLERGGYRLWTRDTVLARGDTVPSDVLLLEGSARIAGRIEGDLYVVDGDLFLRTAGSVAGDVVVLGGGFYDSDLALVEGSITYRPNERLRVRPTSGDFEILSEEEPRPVFEADGTRGLHLPTYQRVDALTLGAGGLVRAPDAPGRPELEGAVRYKTGPGKVEGSVRTSWYPGARIRLGLFGERRTRSNEEWIRPAWVNGLAHAVAGDDLRDHYRADRAGIELELVSPEPPLWEDAPRWRVGIAAGWEEARSLVARDVFVLFGEEVPEEGIPYPNRGVDDGDLFTARAAFDWELRGREGRVGFGLGLEAARDDDIPGDFDFLLAEARLSARRATAWGHAWEVFIIARTDLAGALPRQRHSTLGGVGTLPTLPLRGSRGPRLAYAEATWAVPLLGMPTVGGLDAFLRASAGTTWGGGRAFRLEENLSGGLAARLWDFQLELGAAAGSGPGSGDLDAVVFLDLRVRRSATPRPMPERGRGW